jgi:hypothetical protein
VNIRNGQQNWRQEPLSNQFQMIAAGLTGMSETFSARPDSRTERPDTSEGKRNLPGPITCPSDRRKMRSFSDDVSFIVRHS